MRDGEETSVALVTGGAGGIGRAIVEALEARGARVAAYDVAPPASGSLRLVGDVADEDAVGAAVRRVEAELGPVAHLVCAAGCTSDHPVTELTLEEWQRVVDASLLGTFLATRAVLPGMVRRGDGRIVALSSGFARRGARGGAHYAAAKSGVEAFVKSVALEVGEHGITANAVAPGPVDSPMLVDLQARPGWQEAMVGAIPMGRIGMPSDVVAPVLFLLEPAAGYVTGQVIHVNGGLVMP